MKRRPKILVSGGGTGGHIFPALSIADACRRRFDADVLFVGAEGRMEMERVPAAGYPIKALPVAGFNRKNLLKNFSVLLKLRRSLKMARDIVRDFKPDVAVGVGGYASGPILKAAQKAGVPTLLQEQNSYAGVTNKLLASKANAICVAYEGMERFFPAEKIVLSGNPVRKNITSLSIGRTKAAEGFGLNPAKPVLLVVGGSLGALTLNESMAASVRQLADRGVQVIWQTGNYYFDKIPDDFKHIEGVVVTPFLTDMAAAYAAATLVVARAGAGTISELQLLGKPSVLVPSPHVAEDHQTKNARALASRGAAVLLPDDECRLKLEEVVSGLVFDAPRLEAIGKAARDMALPDSDEVIADEIEKLLKYFSR